MSETNNDGTKDPRHYSVVETVRGGRPAEIRALRPEDRSAMLSAVSKMSAEGRYRRFFAPKRSFSEKEVDFYVNVDFVDHVALVAVVQEAGQPVIVGGGRYIVSVPGRAEVAFSVDDAYQGLGIGSALMRHLVKLARAAELTEFFAEVLPENSAMRTVFARSGLPVKERHEGGVVHVTLALAGDGK